MLKSPPAQYFETEDHQRWPHGPRRRAAGRPLSGRLVDDSKRPLCGIHIEPRVASTAGAREVLWDWAVWRLDRNHLIRLLPAHLLHIGWDAKTSEGCNW